MLSNKAKQTLKGAGFTSMEVTMIDGAESLDGRPQKTDINAGVWRDAIKSRGGYLKRLKDEGWDKVEIEDVIDSFYSEEVEANPWDFIKIEYKPAKKLADFQYAAAQRSLKRIDSHFGEEYRKRR